MLLPLQGGGLEGDGDLPEQYNYVFSIMDSLVSVIPAEARIHFAF